MQPANCSAQRYRLHIACHTVVTLIADEVMPQQPHKQTIQGWHPRAQVGQRAADPADEQGVSPGDH